MYREISYLERPHSKVNLVGQLDAEKLAEAGRLYVFIIGFPASLLKRFWVGRSRLPSYNSDEQLQGSCSGSKHLWATPTLFTSLNEYGTNICR